MSGAAADVVVRRWLLASAVVVSTCGMLYELALGTVASYVLGSSVVEFSIVLGLYVSAMGAGAALSARVGRGLWPAFLALEVLIALVGGLSGPALLVLMPGARLFAGLLYGAVVVVGALVGAELPLLVRILEGSVPFKDAVGLPLAYDYAGGLVASIFFPLVLVPLLGLARTSLVGGLASATVALLGTWVNVGTERKPNAILVLRAGSLATLVVLALFFARSEALLAAASD